MRLAKYSLLLVFTLIGCGDEASEDSSTESAVENADSIYGVWKVEEIVLEDDKEQAIAFSGNNTLTLRANSSYVASMETVSLSSGDTEIYTNCTMSTSGQFKIEDGEIFYSKRYGLSTDGECGVDITVGEMFKISNATATVSMVGDKLKISTEYTYLGVDGKPQKDSLYVLYNRKSEETWDGDGVDPRWEGSWKFFDIWIKLTCDGSDNDGLFKANLSGSMTLTVTDSDYTIVQKDFAVGSIDACTGTSKGTIEPSQLDMTYTETEADSECSKYSEETEGKIQSESREFVVPSDKMIGMNSFSVPNEICTDKRLYIELTSILEKQ